MTRSSNYLHDLDDQDNEQIKQNIKDLLLYCSKIMAIHGISQNANKGS